MKSKPQIKADLIHLMESGKLKQILKTTTIEKEIILFIIKKLERSLYDPSFKLGLYCLKIDKTKTIEAQNKFNAAHLLNVSINEIECLISKDIYKKTIKEISEEASKNIDS
jgi:hypothetical protein